MSDHPSAARLLLLTGAPATGKSRLAAALAQRYGACQCSKDEIKELLFDVLGSGEAGYSRRLSDASFALLFAFLPRLLRPGRLLVVDGNFRPGEHERALERVLAPQRVDFAQIWCRALPATRAVRLMARATDPGRHPGHHDARALLPAAAAEGYLELPGPRWQYDSEQPWEQAVTALCGTLDCWGVPRGIANP
jgi:predicted kinase